MAKPGLFAALASLLAAALLPACDAVNLPRVQPGMSRDEIRRLLGAPGSRTVFRNSGEEVWEWRIEGMPVMDETYFMVHFDAESGLVKKTSRRVAAKG
jgi:hypothetical protein